MAVFIQNREEFEQQLVIMKTQDGWSIRALARHFAVSRNMVRRILRKHEKLRDQGHDILLADSRQSLGFKAKWTGALTPSSSLKPAKPTYNVSPTSSVSPGGILLTSP
ncbi:MAG TPA: helix-turn-helix domain-containing protein [Syntrophales bacterium]|nr:helix-turn-helix domain-containing protein [Syntrophales bacterium]